MYAWKAAALGTGFLFLMTTLGAASVFLLGGHGRPYLQRLCTGFAAGVMLAASVWSLLNPAIAASEAMGVPGWIPAGGGILCGAMFLLLSDAAAARLSSTQNGPDPNRRHSFLLQLAVTLHNIPEGMAVGLSFALVSDPTLGVSGDRGALSAAVALALGIGIQNLPEGAAIALPLCQRGLSRRRAFLRGCLSGIVEPIFGMLSLLAVGYAEPFMPWLLSFAAGAMLYVVAEELIPEANRGKASYVGTLSILGGFLVMMVLDVALG